MNYLQDQYNTVLDAVRHSPDETFETTIWARNHADAGALEGMLDDALDRRVRLDLVTDDGRWGVWVRVNDLQDSRPSAPGRS